MCCRVLQCLYLVVAVFKINQIKRIYSVEFVRFDPLELLYLVSVVAD